MNASSFRLQRRTVSQRQAPRHRQPHQMIPGPGLRQGSGQIINVCSGAGQNDPPVAKDDPITIDEDVTSTFDPPDTVMPSSPSPPRATIPVLEELSTRSLTTWLMVPTPVWIDVSRLMNL